MKKIIKLTESDLHRIVKRAINEESSEQRGHLYSKINSLIDNEFSDMDPSDVSVVLQKIAKFYESDSERKRKGIGFITKDEVLKNFRKNVK
jgi:type III secretory pathway lipoprotein EscJ